MSIDLDILQCGLFKVKYFVSLAVVIDIVVKPDKLFYERFLLKKCVRFFRAVRNALHPVQPFESRCDTNGGPDGS